MPGFVFEGLCFVYQGQYGMNMGDGTGLELYKQVHLKYPQIGFILLTNDVRFSVQNQADLYNIPLISKSTSDLIARIIEMINA